MTNGGIGGTISGVSGNLHLESDQTRRGSRGSIISGRANVEPTETSNCATIPAHHLAKLSLSISPDYVSTTREILYKLNEIEIRKDSDDSDSASDLVDAPTEDVSPRFSQSHPQQQPPNAYKSRHRAYRRGRAEQQQQQLEQRQQQQNLSYALEYHQVPVPT
jgi:hypothetical protein